MQLLGQGGFADVYLGEHIYLKTQAAIKLLRVQLSDENIDDFMNEARMIAQLEHPNIVRVFECGITDDCTPFLVMTYAPNGSLRQRHPKGSCLLPTQIIPYVQQVAEALHYAHQHKLIHRDVKPENMLIGLNHQLLLSDFGLALLAQSSSMEQSTREMAGTVPYMPPEQLQGRPRFASDQYALAIAVYEWLCGERPFSGTFMEVVSQQVLSAPLSLCERVPGLAPDIERVIFRALAKDPTERFENILAFANAFTEVCGPAQSNATVPLALASGADPDETQLPRSRQTQPWYSSEYNTEYSTASFASRQSVQSSLVLTVPSSPVGKEYVLRQTDQMMVQKHVIGTMSTITPPRPGDMASTSATISDSSASTSAVITPSLASTLSMERQRHFWQFVVLFAIALTLLGMGAGMWFSRGYLAAVVPVQFVPAMTPTVTRVRSIKTVGAQKHPESGGTVPNYLKTTPAATNSPTGVARPSPSPTQTVVVITPTSAPTLVVSPATPVSVTPTPMQPTPTPIPPTPTMVSSTPTSVASTPTVAATMGVTPTPQVSSAPVPPAQSPAQK
jgi:serine/threonine protein kinase